MWEILMEMERFNGRAKAEDQGAVGLGIGLGEGLGACQPPCGLGVGDVLQLLQEDLAGALRVCRTPEANAVLKDARRSRSRPSRLSCQGRSGVACFYALFVAHDSSQSTNCMFATARLRCRVSTHSGTDGRCTQIVEITGGCMPSNYDTITTLSKPKKSWDNIPDLVVSLERNLCGHLLPGLWKNDGKEYPDGNAHTCIEQEVFSISLRA